MKNRILSLTMLFAFISIGIFAQEKPVIKIHQIGINFSNLNQFGLHYKTGTEKTLLCLSLLSITLRNDKEWGRPEDSLDIKQQSYGGGFRLGFEKRVPVVAHLNFIWGLEGGCNISYNKSKIKSTYTNADRSELDVTPLVGLIIGVDYTIADHLVIGAEISPYLHYTYGKVKTTNNDQTVESTTSSFGFSFNNNVASLSLAYRFGK